jgi:hypothetical protein
MLQYDALKSLKWLFLAAQRAGIRLAPMEALPDDAGEPVFWKHYLQCLADTAQLERDARVGLRLGREISIVDLGQHTYLFLNAAKSIGDYLNLHASHGQISHSVSHFDFRARV